MRKFTKYPSNYVMASTSADSTTVVTLLDALGAGFEHAWESMIEKEELDDSAYEDALVDFRNFFRTSDSFTEEQKRIVLAMLYELEDGYTKSMDSFANTPGYESDSAFWRALDKIRKYLKADNSVEASTSIKADSEYTSSNPLKVDCPRGPYYVWEEFGKFKGSVNNPDTFISDAHKINTFDGFNSLDEVIDYVKKYF